jgi:signal transduction histidine kinase
MWLLVAALVLAMGGAVAVYVHRERRDALAQAALRADDTSRLLQEHVGGLLRATDFILTQAAAIGAAALAGTGNHWAEKRELSTLEKGLPEKGHLWIVAADGRLALGTGPRPDRRVNVADRAYFQANRSGRTLVVGPLVHSRIHHVPVFTVSRRIEDGKGRFLGIALAEIRADYFADFYQALNLGRDARIAIIDGQGRIIMIEPPLADPRDRSIATAPLLKAAQSAPAGILRLVSPYNGVERVVGYRAIPHYGVVVTCGIAIPAALTAGFASNGFILPAMVAVALVLAVLIFSIFHGIDRERGLLIRLEHAVAERTEEARRQAEEARRANESKTRFLAAASHDLRQPLQAAGMFVEVLANRLDGSPDALIADKLRHSIDATATLLSTLLDISTLEAGKIRPNVAAFPLMPLLASLADQMEPEATQRGLAIRVAPTSAWISSDPVLLERLLRNLMVNALRYTKQGGVVVGGRCRRSAAGVERVAIQVVDSGIGIPADKQDMIFEDFTRLESDLRGGPGLGLGVVRRTARLLDHDISVTSRVGHGSTFTLMVPAARRPRAIEDRVESDDAAAP